MVDTVRTLAALQTLLADNDAQAIDPQDLRDFLVSVYPQWQNYTPELVVAAGGTNPTLGTGSEQFGRYITIGDPGLIIFAGYVRFGTSGANAGTGTYRLTLPVAAANQTGNQFMVAYGVTHFRDATDSGNPFTGALRGNNSGDTVDILYANDFVTQAAPFAWTNQDAVGFLGVYEAA